MRPAERIMPDKANHIWIFLFLKRKIVTSEITGIRIIIAASGHRKSTDSKPFPPVSLISPVNVTFVTDPDLSIKVKKLPFRNNNVIRIVNDRYND